MSSGESVSCGKPETRTTSKLSIIIKKKGNQMAKLKPIHPGEILRAEFMLPLHLNPNKLALALHVPAPTIYDIVHEERGISPEMALRLGYFFWTSPDFLLNLQSEFDLRIVRNQKEAEVKSQIRPIDNSSLISSTS
jgi:addiction module HigA family antidote